MKLLRLLPFIFLISATVLGQGAAKPQRLIGPNGNAVFAAENNCPVDMAIERGGLYAKRYVAGKPDAGPNNPIEQRIRLNLTNRNAATITGARITIHGLSQKTRFLEVSTPRADMAKAMELSLDLKGKGQSSTLLWLSRFAAITRVDLDEVTYADGTAWHELTPAGCSVVPSLLVPVGVEIER